MYICIYICVYVDTHTHARTLENGKHNTEKW